jgi:aspartate racemase
MPAHIGIVACSGPGAALCWETICAEAPATLGGHAHPEVSMHAFSFGEHMRLLEADDWPGIGGLMLASVRKLAAMGADFAICPDNTIHQALPWVLPASPLPWLHIAEVVAAEAVRSGARRVGILGTRWLVEGEVYPEKLDAAGVAWCRPPVAERDVVNGIIFGDLVYGRVADEGRRALVGIVERLGTRDGCDAVVLGCTELPLVLTPDVCPLPGLDSTRLLARAAIARAAAADAS